jgi:lipopolysaccharide biosynthesis protein
MRRKLLRFAVKAAQRLQMSAASLAAFFRRRGTYVVERIAGADAGPIDGRVCVFAHYDRKGFVHDYVLHYLAALRSAGFRIVFVTNSPGLSPSEVDKLKPLTHAILRRKNVGRFFGAYKDGIAAIDDLGAVDLLLLADDSLYGPFSPLGATIRRVTALPGQFWSLTDSWDRAYHLDTDFLLFSREAIASEAFRTFFSRLRYVNSKYYVFRHYEVGLSQALIRAGLRGSALCSYRDMSRAVVEAVRGGALSEEIPDDDRKAHLNAVYELIQKGKPFNLDAYLWDYLITAMGYPFIKSELFERRGVNAPYISHWQRIVTQESSYDPDLIVRHLETTLRNRFT